MKRPAMILWPVACEGASPMPAATTGRMEERSCKSAASAARSLQPACRVAAFDDDPTGCSAGDARGMPIAFHQAPRQEDLR
ncbi:hypothetical protein C3942_20180 [Solimonas fluminis]|uniref:Uncharacterized protein n=1 Tax=Solimonas fluminis TaxID=2086571 RepID=A0A2S5TAM2_9GAMM|nr:hypothetical protein C3942_20180 [Solimonas fluminis]